VCFVTANAGAALELTRFGGHLILSEGGAHDAAEQTAVPT
jgi:hypothetical protein